MKVDLPVKISVELHGTVKSIAATQWVIAGSPSPAAGDVVVKIASTTVIYPDPKVGDRVVVVGTRDSSGALTATKISKELGWMPKETFESGLLKTVRWYLDNQTWTDRVMSGAYRDWIQKNYAAR